MITLKDIAKESGVSVMTVSNVINGNHSKVSKNTIEKVNSIIKKYNYIPNSAARMLSSRASKIIAMCIPGYKNESLLTSPYNSNLIGVIERIVYKKGYYLMLCSAEENEEIVSNLRTWNVDGSFFLGVTDKNISNLKKQLKFPIVFLDSSYKLDEIINVGSNDYKGGYLAGRYLANAGHRNIGFASNDLNNSDILYNRFSGFQKALLESGITLPDDHIFKGDISYEGGIAVGKEIANKKNITAVFSTADIMSIGIIEGARLGGLTVPRDLSVIGFDDLPICNYVTPKLTTIHQDITKKGELAANLLFELIEHENCKGQNIVLDVELVERQSVMPL